MDAVQELHAIGMLMVLLGKFSFLSCKYILSIMRGIIFILCKKCRVFVYECKDSGIPMDALNTIYLFSPHAITNMRGAIVPTSMLTPKLESMVAGGGGDLSKKWKASGIWRHVVVNSGGQAKNAEQISSNNGNESDEDSGVGTSSGTGGLSMRGLRSSRLQQTSSTSNGNQNRNRNGNQNGNDSMCIHDMDLSEGLPSLAPMSSTAGDAGMDLERLAPVRIELFFPRVYYYDPNDAAEHHLMGMDDSERKVHQKVFCMVVVTPARNFSLTEYVRLYIAEGNISSSSSGGGGGLGGATAADTLVHRRELLQEVLLDQIGMCEHLRRYMYHSASCTTFVAEGNQSDEQDSSMLSSAMLLKNPLDVLNMPSHDLFPGNYLCIQMAYRKIQNRLHKSYGIDHHKIYVEGFSQTVNLLTKKDLQLVRQFNFAWHHSFYEQCVAFESIKAEERAEFKAVLADSNAPWYVSTHFPKKTQFCCSSLLCKP